VRGKQRQEQRARSGVSRGISMVNSGVGREQQEKASRQGGDMRDVREAYRAR
jgi:hypothetical protein